MVARTATGGLVQTIRFGTSIDAGGDRTRIPDGDVVAAALAVMRPSPSHEAALRAEWAARCGSRARLAAARVPTCAPREEGSGSWTR